MTNNYTPLNLKKLKDFYPLSLSKETEPVKKEVMVFEEKTEFEPKKEINPYVYVKPKSIKLPPDLKKIGLQTNTIHKNLVYKNITLPISDEKIVSGLHAPVTSSLRWLATLAVYLLKKAHLQLKVIHGRVTRVFKS